jgi:lactoylglutathione lyase
LKRSTDFYESLLGLERIADPFKDDRHVFFRIGAHAELHLIAGATAIPDRDINVHLAFRVPSVETFVARLKKAQVGYFNANRESEKVTLRPDGVMQIYFQDPDGYWIEVNDKRN